MRFRDKTAIVVGAGRDIGRACALRLGREGANVVIGYHASDEGARSAVTEIEGGRSGIHHRGLHQHQWGDALFLTV